MTSLSCGVDALLRAAQFLEDNEGQLHRPTITESPQFSTGTELANFTNLKNQNG